MTITCRLCKGSGKKPYQDETCPFCGGSGQEKTTEERMRECEVKADSVEDFLDRYYRSDRYRGRGEEHRLRLLRAYQEELEKEGFCWLDAHASVQGRILSFFGNNHYNGIDRKGKKGIGKFQEEMSSLRKEGMRRDNLRERG